MRYLVTFRSFGEDKKRTKRLSQEQGEKAVALLAQGKHIVINGEYYNAGDIDSIRKINVENFGADFAEQQARLELQQPEERKYLESRGFIPLQLKNAEH